MGIHRATGPCSFAAGAEENAPAKCWHFGRTNTGVRGKIKITTESNVSRRWISGNSKVRRLWTPQLTIGDLFMKSRSSLSLALLLAVFLAACAPAGTSVPATEPATAAPATEVQT